MEKTLLEKALEQKARRSGEVRVITDEHIELALAWTRGEITLTQAEVAVYNEKAHGMNIYVTLARSLREAVKVGKLKIV